MAGYLGYTWHQQRGYNGNGVDWPVHFLCTSVVTSRDMRKRQARALQDTKLALRVDCKHAIILLLWRLPRPLLLMFWEAHQPLEVGVLASLSRSARCPALCFSSPAP
jgi:hypothetical protein